MSPNASATASRTSAPTPTSSLRLRSVEDDGGLPHVAVVGLGYVGLPTALAFAAAGATVTGLDVSIDRLAAIEARDVDLTPADHERLASHIDTDLITLTMDAESVADADVVLICVPTPVDAHHVPDLGALEASCRDVVERVRPGQTIVLTSTTYPGTTRDLLVGPLAERGFTVGEDVHVAFSPERIDPGNVAFPQDRVPRVVGGVTPACTEKAAAAIATVAPVHEVSTPEAAELTKLFENTFRAVNISLVNELAEVSTAYGLDVMEVVEAADSKPYGFMRFTPGPGVGGHCIPTDPHYLLWALRPSGVDTPLITEAMSDIARRPRQVATRVRDVLADRGVSVNGATVLVEGVAYKPGVADVRESPALIVIDELASRGVDIRFHDEFVPTLTTPQGRTFRSEPDPSQVDADLVLVHTMHPGDHEWLRDAAVVLDATYRLTDLPNRATV